MKLIGLGNDKWINADFIESIDESYDGRCRVWTIGSNENYFSTGYTADELIDILEADGVEIVPFKRPHAGDIINFFKGER